jgi:hypothetical protein
MRYIDVESSTTEVLVGHLLYLAVFKRAERIHNLSLTNEKPIPTLTTDFRNTSTQQQ